MNGPPLSNSQDPLPAPFSLELSYSGPISNDFSETTLEPEKLEKEMTEEEPCPDDSEKFYDRKWFLFLVYISFNASIIGLSYLLYPDETSKSVIVVPISTVALYLRLSSIKRKSQLRHLEKMAWRRKRNFRRIIRNFRDARRMLQEDELETEDSRRSAREERRRQRGLRRRRRRRNYFGEFSDSISEEDTEEEEEQEEEFDQQGIRFREVSSRGHPTEKKEILA